MPLKEALDHYVELCKEGKPKNSLNKAILHLISAGLECEILPEGLRDFIHEYLKNRSNDN
ncbi:MAG: hypothetical protein Q6365_023855 [Candidatus Sigynarchaeota archaeon]